MYRRKKKTVKKRAVKKKTTKKKVKKKAKRKVVKKRKMTSKLAGYTKTKGKYALVFKKNGKLSVGKGRYSSKNTMVKAAQRYLKK